MGKIEKIREGLYIKHNKFFGSKVVYPIKSEDGKIIWFNLLAGGSWGNLLTTFIILFLIFFMCFSYYHDVKTCFEVLKNPCDYCNPYNNIGFPQKFSLDEFNFSNKGGENYEP